MSRLSWCSCKKMCLRLLLWVISTQMKSRKKSHGQAISSALFRLLWQSQRHTLQNNAILERWPFTAADHERSYSFLLLKQKNNFTNVTENKSNRLLVSFVRNYQRPVHPGRKRITSLLRSYNGFQRGVQFFYFSCLVPPWTACNSGQEQHPLAAGGWGHSGWQTMIRKLSRSGNPAVTAAPMLQMWT